MMRVASFIWGELPLGQNSSAGQSAPAPANVERGAGGIKGDFHDFFRGRTGT